jgi:hypothetical protein
VRRAPTTCPCGQRRPIRHEQRVENQTRCTRWPEAPLVWQPLDSSEGSLLSTVSYPHQEWSPSTEYFKTYCTRQVHGSTTKGRISHRGTHHKAITSKPACNGIFAIPTTQATNSCWKILVGSTCTRGPASQPRTSIDKR